MKEKIKFPCGCKTVLDGDKAEFIYCDGHSVDKLQKKIEQLEGELKFEKSVNAEFENEKKKLRNEADFEYFKLLDKTRDLEKEIGRQQDIGKKLEETEKKNEDLTDQLRRLGVEMVKMKQMAKAAKVKKGSK